MTDSIQPGTRGMPLEGDLVVSREARSAVRYTVSRVPGEAQFSASARDEALRLARGYARKYCVDIWYSEDGACRPLESYRPQTATVLDHEQA